MAFTTTPEILAYIETRRRQHVAFVRCPYCGDVHQHGAGLAIEPADLGYREAHCLTGPGGAYRLVPGLTQKPAALTDKERTRRLMADDRARGRVYVGSIF